MKWNFWPLINVDIDNTPEWHYTKSVKYSDGKWLYESDSNKGVSITVKCSCGAEHTIKLGKSMAIEYDGEIINVEEIKDEHPTSTTSSESGSATSSN